MSEPTDVKRLLARGTTVQLADGANHEFRFPARALARMEEDYGTLDALAEALNSKPFTTLAYVIHVTLGVPREAAVDLIDTRRTVEYVDAIGRAFEEALPNTPVKVRILQNHEFRGNHYRAGSEVEVPRDVAKHLLEARVAEAVVGNGKAAPAWSPGAAFSALQSPAGTSPPSDSGT